MKTTGERRLSKTARRYAVLAQKDKKRCRDQWRKFILQPYLDEIQKRADRLRLEGRRKNQRRTPAQIELLAKSCGNLGIFDVYRRADRLLIAAGDTVERLVGDETRKLLVDECAKAVAGVYDKRLYQLVKKHFYNRMS